MADPCATEQQAKETACANELILYAAWLVALGVKIIACEELAECEEPTEAERSATKEKVRQILGEVRNYRTEVETWLMLPVEDRSDLESVETRLRRCQQALEDLGEE